MSLSKAIDRGLKKALPMLINDERLAVSVTYRRYLSQSFSKEAGESVATYEDLKGIIMIDLGLTVKTKRVDNSPMVERTRMLFVRAEDMPPDYETVNVTRDKIIVEGEGKEYAIASAEPVIKMLYAFGLTV